MEKLSLARDYGSAFLRDAPLAIVVTGDGSLTDIWIEDTVISAIILQLTAKSLDWVLAGSDQGTETQCGEDCRRVCQRTSGYPQEVKVQCIIGIGYPSEQKPAKTDDDLHFDRVFYNGYGKK